MTVGGAEGRGGKEAWRQDAAGGNVLGFGAIHKILTFVTPTG